MADFSHSLQRTQASSATISKKLSNGNGFATKTVYDDVFGGASKFGFSSRVEDYSEIFGSYHSSRGSSIPILDLPVVDEDDASIDVRSSKFDYSEVFGGFDCVDFAVPYEELFVEPKKGEKESSSEEAWTPAETGSPSEESSEELSENNQAFTNAELHHAYNDVKQFNMSYHKTNQIGKDDGISGTTHIAHLNAVPAFTYVVDEEIPFRTEICDKLPSQMANSENWSLNYSGGVMEGRHFQTTMSENPACDTISRTSRSVNSSGEIMVGKHFQKTTSEEPACENPACDTISRTSRSVNSSGEIMVGIHFQKTTSEEPACETVSRTSKSVNSNGGVIEGEHFQKITLEEPGCDTVSRTSKSVNSNGGVVMEGKRLQKTTSEEPAYDTVLRTSKIVNSNCGVMEGKQFKKTMSEEPAFDTVSRTSKSVNSNGVMEGKHFQKTTSEEPACDAVSRASKIAKPNGRAMEGKHFQKTSSDEPVCATCSRTCSSDFKPQRNPSGNGSYPGGVFLSVAEINLRTQPCHVPPPSRPPPKLTIKQGDPKRSMTSNLKTSTNFAHEDATSDASLPFFDVEIDASSSAAASAAAMKEAMEKAQVRLKSAKELMERKKDGLQNRKKLGLKEDIKGKESREDEIIHEACKIKEEKSHGKFEREKNELKGFDRGQKQRSTGASQVAPDFEARATVLNASQDSVDQKHVKEYRSTQEELEEGAGEWKAEDQFYELVNKDEFETLAKAPEQKKAERKSVPTIESYEHEQNDMIAAKGAFKQKEENDGKFQAAAAKAQLDEAVRKLKVAKEAHECEEHDTQKEAQGLEESEQKIKGASEREEHERKLREASEWEEYENKLKEALAMEEYEKQLKEACEREEHEKKQKKSPERKENEINQNEACQKEENENRQQEAREREENEKRLKGLCEVEEYEKKLLKVAEELEENKMRQKQACVANERRLKEAHERAVREREICEQEKYLKLQKEAREREENEKRVRELQEQEENEKRHEQIRKKKENERKLEEVCERQETEERPKEPFQREENKKRQQEETCEKEEYEKLQVSQEAHVGKLEEQNLGSVKIFQETAEIVKKSKATTHTCLQDEDTNSKLMNGTYEQEESYETLKRAPEPCGHEDDGKMKAAKSAFEQKENELKVASEQGERERLMEACMADSSPEHEVCESNEEVASKASLDVNEKESGEPSEGMEQEKYKKSRKGDQVAFVSEDSKNRHKAAQGVRQQVMYEKKMEAPNPVSALEEKRAKLKIFREFDPNQDTERKEKTFSEMREETENGKDRRLREQEKERLRKIEEDRERAREREKDRMAVEQATREARERAYAEACERAERAAVERATAEARQRALAEARERLEKASAEAREKSLAERASVEARLRAERAAVDRATAEARERARERVERSVSEKFSATSRDNGIRHSASFNDLRDFEFQSSNSFNSSQRCTNSSNHGAFPTEKSQGAEVESAQRCKARLERHQRTVERAAKALAEKNRRDILAQREQAERNRLAETLDADVKRWSSGKEGNLRALLSTLQYILGPDSGWQPVPLTEVITAVAVKKAYRKATLCVHPDKLQQRGASIQQKYICEKVFDLLKEAWNKFNSEER